jgi:hypothetical protein
VHYFDFVFTHSLGINENHIKMMGLHLVIISSSTALRVTVTLEEDPGVSDYLYEYLLVYSERLISATSKLPYELEVPPV